MERIERFVSPREKIEELKKENEYLRRENDNLRNQATARKESEDEYYKMLDEVKKLRDSYRSQIRELGDIKREFYADLQNLLNYIRTN